ncbi:MAG: 2TM domain-containing protein [Gemmatimonadota bacterium]
MSDLEDTVSGQELRARAVKRLRKRRDFYGHLVIYILVNGFLVGIWAITGQGFFWPAFVLGAWGIGLLANAWDVFGRQDIDERRIRREMDRLQHSPH